MKSGIDSIAWPDQLGAASRPSLRRRSAITSRTTSGKWLGICKALKEADANGFASRKDVAALARKWKRSQTRCHRDPARLSHFPANAGALVATHRTTRWPVATVGHRTNPVAKLGSPCASPRSVNRLRVALVKRERLIARPHVHKLMPHQPLAADHRVAQHPIEARGQSSESCARPLTSVVAISTLRGRSKGRQRRDSHRSRRSG